MKVKTKSIAAIILILGMMVPTAGCAAQASKLPLPGTETVTDTVSEDTSTDDPETEAVIETETAEAADETEAEEPAVTEEPQNTEPSEETTAPTEQTEEPRVEHSFGDWSVIVSAACTETGTEERVCTICGESETRPTDATGHSYGSWGVTAAATCAQKGTQSRTCTVCGKAETRSTDATGHSYDDWKVTKAATCTASGTRQRVCTKCGDTQTETVTSSHSWSGWKTTQTESYYWIDEYNEVAGKTPAVHSRTCSLCGATESEEYVVSDEEKNALALAVAKQIVAQVDSKTYGTELERVQAAAAIVSAYSQSCIYLQQTTKPKDYKTAYGVFVAGIYTCAGSTRAMGLVLDCMGFKWEHANENGYTHQWCILTMDGKTGYADGQVGYVGYGQHPAAMW